MAKVPSCPQGDRHPGEPLCDGIEVRVRGQVQGVGFRPFVWQLARAGELKGEVLNDAQGVLIRAAGKGLDGFLRDLRAKAPPLARVDAVETRAARVPACAFRIAGSGGGAVATRVTPDAATCPDCLAEIRGEGRRRGYAFTNCTHCGPRFTILRGLPYDRAQTSMAVFGMCEDCRAEYGDPADRRFHAQPIACPACGPHLWLEAAGAEVPGDPVAGAVAILRQGGVLGVKGLGGFHLACNARDPAAVALLRSRKRRPGKPFAIMAAERMLDELAELSEAERALLRDPAAPVVLVRSRGTLPGGVAPGLTTLGLMLPATPLHHLLVDAFGGPLVMTSGNLSGEPQVIGNDEARAKLSGFVDAVLMHDREIVRRLDDSVERARPPMVLRRARGRAPGTLPLPEGFGNAPQVLALGGQMKGAICLLKDGQALLSHHLGDLDDALTFEEFERAIGDHASLFDHRAAVVAVDLHPGYRATQAGLAMGLSVEKVQHHHAHLASCLGDALWPLDAGPVAAVVLDGTGLGTDGTIWGGELLLGDYCGFERVAHLAPAPLPGGEAAAREPWRNALVRLDAAGLPDLADRLFPDLPRDVLRRAVAGGVNSPASSSAGRLFDAVAACLGLAATRQSYEGEAAMRLEALDGDGPPYPFDGLDPAPMFRALARDLQEGAPPGRISDRFHRGLARAFCAPARALVEGGHARAVALTGGCFQNARLVAACLAELPGVPVLCHRAVPANDGGLALGQALVAAARQIGAAEAP
ncbi:carbamoyltransferase HypF [Cereibacter sphaeroides]|uniref:carbamoyltransferase HypF n=1 Tax=Cereibacter sphaeroides TaxID=1063 RepID=UPI001F343F7D|nr:carbamoyltransferase HypF [Cereibacter sphaeroides]MCE6950211.1 carbamoyltransferase HypF [Cereibacter sphaeroides]